MTFFVEVLINLVTVVLLKKDNINNNNGDK